MLMDSRFVQPVVNICTLIKLITIKVSALICDGASSNLSLLKMLVGKRGLLGFDITQTDKHAIPTTFTNPFSGKNVFIIICPSHQVPMTRVINLAL